MSTTQQLPRRSLLWLLAALTIAIVPHIGHLPAWVLAVVCIALGWRYRVHQGRWSFPSRMLKLLLVAMALMGVVTVATVSLYSVSSQSYKTVDANQQLQETARFIFTQVGQAARIAGYEDLVGNVGVTGDRSSTSYMRSVFVPEGLVPAVIGYDNSIINTITDSSDDGGNNRGGVNFSDSVAFRFFGSGLASNGAAPDNSVVDCLGSAVAYPIGTTVADVGLSLFWVRTVNGEPELHCLRQGVGTRETQPIARGVESFQVLYGVDTEATNPDLVPNRWASASDLVATDWPRVRAIRVGLVLRGPADSSQGPSATAGDNTLYPLGQTFIGSTTTNGLIFAAPNDGRLRRTFTAVFVLRNSRGQ